MPGRRQRLPLLVILAAVFVFLFCSLFSYFIFDHIPHINDEIAYLFQAKIFKSGRLYAPSPPCREFFDFPHIINNGRWYSMYPPGFPFLLMLGLIFGIPWMVNPLLAGLSILIFYYLGKEIYDQRIGFIASLLGAASTWFLLMSSTMMSHTSSLFFNALFLLFLFRSLKNPTLLNGMLAGGFLGVALLIRPYNAVLLSLPFLIVFAFRFLKSFRRRRKNALGFISTLFLFVLCLLIYNLMTNSNLFQVGYVVCYGRDVLPGLGRAAVSEFSLTPLRAAQNILIYVKNINTDLFGWPFSSFMALIPLAGFWRIKAERRKSDIFLIAGFFSLLAGFFFYWGTFPLLGARLIFECVIPLVLLSARGLDMVLRGIERIPRRANRKIAKFGFSAALMIFIFYAFLFRLPRWVWPNDTEDPKKTIGRNFSGTAPDIHACLKQLNLNNVLVVMKFLNHPPLYFPSGGWGSGFLYNDPDLSSGVIYARDNGERNQELYRCFPGRDILMYIGTTRKGIMLLLTEEGELSLPEVFSLIEKKKKGSIHLVRDPRDLFFAYSEEFRGFIDSLYREFNPAKIDVIHLMELAESSAENQAFQKSSLCLEAALQLENDPEIRYALVNLLIAAYQKSGQIEEAKRIINFMERANFDAGKFYSIFPERGF
ncbi:MAG: glycosyltransferase family 39 protein [Clostridiales bacterium]|nr:glycosyltransferase family 39 protein [Clostridiales bacterium]